MPDIAGIDSSLLIALAVGALAAIVVLVAVRKARKLLLLILAGATALFWWLAQDSRDLPFVN